MQLFRCIVMSVLLYSGETWAVVQKHISPLVVFQVNCVRCSCGNFLRDHVPSVDILTRCNTFSVESQLQSNRLRWLGHTFRMLDDSLPKKLSFGQVKGRRPPGCLWSSFNDVAVRDCIVSPHPTKMLMTGCFGGTRLASHVPSSSWAEKCGYYRAGVT